MHSSIHDLFRRLGIPPQPPEALQPLLEDRRVTDNEYLEAIRYMYFYPHDWRVWFVDWRQLTGQRTMADRDRLCTQMLEELTPFLRGPVDLMRLTWQP